MNLKREEQQSLIQTIKLRKISVEKHSQNQNIKHVPILCACEQNKNNTKKSNRQQGIIKNILVDTLSGNHTIFC